MTANRGKNRLDVFSKTFLKNALKQPQEGFADITAKAGYGLAILAIAKAPSASEPNYPTAKTSQKSRLAS